MKVLIIGGRGFIGRNVKEYLEAKNREKQEYEIFAPTSSELDCVEE